MRIWVVALFLFAIAGGVEAAQPQAITAPFWRIAAPAGSIRWIEIHDLDPSRATDLYHVQVLERAEGSPPWQFRSLADRMAITASALRASIIGVAREKSVYPENFESAYRKWKELEGAGRAAVCTSEVAKCL